MLFALFLLISGGRMLRLGLFGWQGNKRSCLFLIRNLQGKRKDDVLRLPQLRRSINPSLIEGFFPSLSAVGIAHGGDFCP